MNHDVLHTIQENGVLPLYYHSDPKLSIEVLRTLHASGIRAVEYAERGETALKNFKELRRVCDNELKEVYLGIGTIKNEEMARAYIDAGADFIVCPGLVESVAPLAQKQGIPWIPGCMTPTEIIRAEELGAELVKLYPLNTLGPPFLGAIQVVFPGLSFMPTGGIEMDDRTVGEWIRAGAAAIGGSKLITRPILENRSWNELKEHTGHVLQLIRSLREKSRTPSAAAN